MMPAATTKPDYSVNIENVDQAYFRVVWNRGLRYQPYLIDKGDIEAISQDVRNHLGALVDNALFREAAVAAKDARGLKEANRNEREIMHDLVTHCRQLFTALFTCAPASRVNQAYVNAIRDKIRSEADTQSICFLVGPRVYIPWGLLYDGPPNRDSDPANPDHFGGFWCLNHRVSVIFDPIASPNDFVVTYDNASFQVLTGGDSSELVKAKRALRGSAAERNLMARLRRTYGKPALSSQALRTAWNTLERRLGLLYLFCHADARTIGFSDNDTMSVFNFKTELIKSTTSPRCLVFLNGCFTTNPDAKGTFLEATGREGFCGYIGAETEVPSLFGFRFGLAFQYLLHKGMEVADIMAYLVRRHWPLSLIYGLYAFPHFRITPHSDMSISKLPDDNYSSGPLGAKIA